MRAHACCSVYSASEWTSAKKAATPAPEAPSKGVMQSHHSLLNTCRACLCCMLPLPPLQRADHAVPSGPLTQASQPCLSHRSSRAANTQHQQRACCWQHCWLEAAAWLASRLGPCRAATSCASSPSVTPSRRVLCPRAASTTLTPKTSGCCCSRNTRATTSSSTTRVGAVMVLARQLSRCCLPLDARSCHQFLTHPACLAPCTRMLAPARQPTNTLTRCRRRRHLRAGLQQPHHPRARRDVVALVRQVRLDRRDGRHQRPAAHGPLRR